MTAMSAWALGSKMGLASIGVGSGVMAWVSLSDSEYSPSLCLASHFPKFPFFIFSFVFHFLR